ncbi:1-acyl-sn-glycerol-3-phosphate acyltransferase [gamma proteobacterium IMCC2047]|nr:1-acyl-sn-glycerol-3-phosphate acyltransferase [gamma proteobacterium IMCC2047]
MPTKRPYSIALICVRLPLLILWLILLPIPALLIRLISPHSTLATEKMPMLFHRGVSKIFGLRLKVSGSLSHHRPTLYISNHVSYLDIFLLGSVVPGYFIAKSEVAGWPLFGKLARLQNTLFIERNSRHARAQVDILQQQLIAGNNLILFPEGTSTDGAHVEPFKSSLFHAAESEPEINIQIQPMTLAYTHHKGQLMDQSLRDYYAWYSTMPFLSHFIQSMGMRNADIELILHSPVSIREFESRKACAENCWNAVNDALITRVKTTVSSNNEPY